MTAIGFDPALAKTIIDNPDAFWKFAHRLEDLRLDDAEMRQVAAISPDSWAGMVDVLSNDAAFRAVAIKSWTEGPTSLSAAERATMATGNEAVKERLGQAGTIIGIVVFVLGVIVAIIGVIVAVAAVPITAGGSLAIVVPLIGVVIAMFGAALTIGGGIPLLLQAIAAFMPDRLVRTHNTRMYGGNTGTPFTDADTSTGRIVAVRVWYDKVVRGIQPGRSDSNGSIAWGVVRGSQQGSLGEATLQPDEYLTAMQGRSGWLVDQIGFQTNTNRTIGPWGNGSGGEPFTILPEANGREIVGFQGRAGANLDAIGTLSETYGSTQAGGMGGDPFIDDIPPGARIAKIDIWAGERIDSIQATYTVNGATVPGRRFGGRGGNKHTLELGPHDVITDVRGRQGAEIDSLRFTIKHEISTGERRWPQDGEPWIGGKGGDREFALYPPPYTHVKGFWGRCGERIDALGICVGK